MSINEQVTDGMSENQQFAEKVSKNQQFAEKVSKNQREQEILEILKKSNYAAVEDLAKQLYISPSSIRRDLTGMEKKGLVSRSYGGVTLVSQPVFMAPFFVRKQENRREKLAIVKNAASLILPDTSIFLDSSTTSLNFALVMEPERNNTVYTNNLQLAHLLASKHIKTYMTGGLVSDFDNVVATGSYTLDMLKNIHVDQMFFTCTSLGPEGQITDVNEEETQIRRFMLTRSQTVVFLCSGERYGRYSQHMTTTLDSVDVVVSEEALPVELAQKFPKVRFISSHQLQKERGKIHGQSETD